MIVARWANHWRRKQLTPLSTACLRPKRMFKYTITFVCCFCQLGFFCGGEGDLSEATWPFPVSQGQTEWWVHWKGVLGYGCGHVEDVSGRFVRKPLWVKYSRMPLPLPRPSPPFGGGGWDGGGVVAEKNAQRNVWWDEWCVYVSVSVVCARARVFVCKGVLRKKETWGYTSTETIKAY